LVEVEVPRPDIEHAVDERLNGFVLEDVFVAVEIVHRVGRRFAFPRPPLVPPPLLEAPEQRIEGESPHIGRKLPQPGARRKVGARRAVP